VLPWGLWVRPAVEPAHADEVRTAPADPRHALILCDDSVVDELPRLRALAEDVVRRLPPEDGLLVRGVTADRPWGAPSVRPRPAPALPAGPAPEPPREMAAPPVPAPPVWENTGTPKDTAVVSLALQHEPGLGGLLPPDIVLAGLLAVRLQLTVAARRAAEEEWQTPPSDVPPEVEPDTLAALCLLPVHHGVVGMRADLDAATLARYRTHRTATASHLFSASLTGMPGAPGNTDVLLFSVTGRRTALLEPELPDRVLFTPGTRFQVLGVGAPARGRAVVLLGELPPPSFCGIGGTDREAMRRLGAALWLWRADERDGVVRPRGHDPFARPPEPDGPAPGLAEAGARPVALNGRYR
jgi:hypothetical protein